jgi:hypothetical protein
LFKYALPALAFATAATPASAGTAYLSRPGSGTTCTYQSPCGFIGDALTAAGANGEVICLNKGSYGSYSLGITQSVTISCGDGLWEAPGEELTINTPRAPTWSSKASQWIASPTSTPP